MNIQAISSKKERVQKGHRIRVKRFRRSLAKYGLLTLNIIIVFSVGGFLYYGRKTANQPTPVANVRVTETDDQQPVVLDQVSAADIAVHIAEAVRLPEVDQVRNQADSRNALVSIAVSDDVVVSKPQIVSDASGGTQSRKDITEHTSVAGDTVSSLAQKYNVSSDSIRWSNGLSGDNVSAGTKLVIPPKNRNGVVYKVASGGTIEKIADKYKTTTDKLISFNDLEISNTLPVGENIFIPDGVKPADPRPVSTSLATSNVRVSGTIVASYGRNGYAAGYCTWWAADRRAQTGRPVPSNLGNAITWLAVAQSIGYATGTLPQVGAVVWFRKPATSLGHVAIVEQVFPDGSFELSEMNGRAGWGRVSRYTVPVGEVDDYRFIY